MMPLADPAMAMLGCMILLFGAAMFALAIVAVILGIWSRRKRRPATAWFVRWSGVACFLVGLVGVILYSHGLYSAPGWYITTWAVLAVLGFAAWLLGLYAAERREIAIGSIVGPACILVAGVIVWRDFDYRQRRDELFSAALRGNPEVVRGLLATGLSPDLTDEVGTRLLEKAADPKTAVVILDAGAKVRAAPRALVVAAERGNVRMTKLLLARGGDPNVRRGNYSAAKLAWWNGHEAILDVLRDAGSEEAATLQRLTGVLIASVKSGDAEKVRRALKDEYLSKERREGLQYAAAKGDEEITLILVDHTEAYAEIADAALGAGRNGHWQLYERLMAVLEKRQAGYIIVETKAKAESLRRAK